MNRRPATATKYSKQDHEKSDKHGQVDTAAQKVIYEQPLNERIRTLLRLEFLFNQANTHAYRHSGWDSRAGISTLFDIVDVFSRSDLKTDILKELEKQAGFLKCLAENPNVDKSRLDDVLDEMESLSDYLFTLKAQDLDIRNNEFLSAIKQRNSIAGGSCDFDLPAYHYWLAQDEEKRILDIQHWLEPFDSIRQSVNLILRLTRDSGQASNEIAENGFYQKTLENGQSCQLLRVTLPGGSPFFSEVSGGKQRFSIRFMIPNFSERPIQTTEDVPFELTCCML